MHCCAVTVDEYERAPRSLPIVFIKDNSGIWTSMCMLGIKQDVNLCVDADGNWASNIYIPAWIRSYPFTFIRQDNNTLVPALEQSAFSLDPNEGTPLYTEAGEPTGIHERRPWFPEGIPRSASAYAPFSDAHGKA